MKQIGEFGDKILPNINENTTCFGRLKKKKTKETVKREQEKEGGWSRKAERNSDCGIWNTKCVF